MLSVAIGVMPSGESLPGTRPLAEILQQRRLGEGPFGSEIGDARHMPTLSAYRGNPIPLHLSLARTRDY